MRAIFPPAEAQAGWAKIVAMLNFEESTVEIQRYVGDNTEHQKLPFTLT